MGLQQLGHRGQGGLLGDIGADVGGDQQQLVALAVDVRLSRDLVHTDPQQTDDLLEEVGTQANEALATLRELPRGIVPAVLADQGLAAALEGPASRSQPGVTLVSEPRLLGRRFSPQSEPAVYFCGLFGAAGAVFGGVRQADSICTVQVHARCTTGRHQRKAGVTRRA